MIVKKSHGFDDFAEQKVSDTAIDCFAKRCSTQRCLRFLGEALHSVFVLNLDVLVFCTLSRLVESRPTVASGRRSAASFNEWQEKRTKDIDHAQGEQ